MLKIIKYPNQILRRQAKKVASFDAELKDLAGQMAEAMLADDGVGLAGPQVDKSRQIIVVGKDKGKYTVYVNPEITFKSKDTAIGEEGCLSLPQIFGLVKRAKKIHLKYQDLDGKVIKEKLKGFEAVVLQHEVDHLNGILFIDRADKITQGAEILAALKKQIDAKIK